METFISILQVLAAVTGGLVALLSIFLFIRFRWPSPMLWFLKLYVSACSPFFVFAGAFVTIVGHATGSIFDALIGEYVFLVFLIYIFRVTRPPGYKGSFEKAFGHDWKSKIPIALKKYFLPSRRVLRLPSVPEPRLEQNVVFANIPGSDRALLCDIWQPPSHIKPSGLAFIYLHGSAFYLLDKDCGTRPFFRHLAAQGHVIMDVAYRLYPETDMMGMTGDVKRAIAWMKENAYKYGVDPDRIVVGGGSAGGHLALLAAYTAYDPEFTPKELAGIDISACAVISLYGSNDFEATYYHTYQHLTTRNTPGKSEKPVPTTMPAWIKKKMGEDYHRLGFDKGFEYGFASLLGGHPDECPQTYALFSPVNHVHANCPPTLLIHGTHDILVPVASARKLHSKLTEQKVPGVLHVLPQADHGFDLVMPAFSPSAHTAYYDVERFLALQIKNTFNNPLDYESIKENIIMPVSYGP